MTEYSFLDRVLHRAALQFRPIAELSFDLDQAATSNPQAIASERHVFVSGLARAGTTILMRRIYQSGSFCSLTYRNMPFVLAPNMWKKLTRLSGSERPTETKERAHGDRIRVNADSPESLDEVFWRIFDGENYIHLNHFVPHNPDQDLAAKYVAYVNAILTSDRESRNRYLSKNNNNLLRLKTIKKCLPQAIILVPFRAPLAHANSLLRQHRNFTEQQKSDGFVRNYMRWLAHHEFGLDHKPFRFDMEGAQRLSAYAPHDLNYWLELWFQTYNWLERTAPADVVYVCYEDLCRKPDIWAQIASFLEIDLDEQSDFTFIMGAAGPEASASTDLINDCMSLYNRLRDRASSFCR